MSLTGHFPAALVAGQHAWPITERPTVIGRWDDAVAAAPEVDLSNLDPTRSVSRRHAEIRSHSGHDWLTDLSSGNGTWVDGRRLEPGEEVALTHARALRFGDVEVTYLSAPVAAEDLGAPGAPSNALAHSAPVAALPQEQTSAGPTGPAGPATGPAGLAGPAGPATGPAGPAGLAGPAAGPAAPPRDPTAPAPLGVDHWALGEVDPTAFVRTHLRRDAPAPPPTPAPAPARRRWRKRPGARPSG